MDNVITIGAADHPEHEASSAGVKKKKIRVTPAIREQVKQLLLANPGLTDSELLAEVHISLASLYRVLTDFRSKGELPFRRSRGQTFAAGKKRPASGAQLNTAEVAAAPAVVCEPESGEAGAEVAATTSLPSEEAIGAAVAAQPVSTSAEVTEVPATAPVPTSFLSRVLSLFVSV